MRTIDKKEKPDIVSDLQAKARPISKKAEKRARIRNAFSGNVAVEEIPSERELLPADQKPKLRVCAYCRVSTEMDTQVTSYELQVQNYTEYITQNPDWEFAGIYADEGIDISNCRFYNISPEKPEENDGDKCAIYLKSYYGTRAYNCSFTNLEIFNCYAGIEIAGISFEFRPQYYISPEESYDYGFVFDEIYCHELWCGGLVLGALYDSVVRNSRFINCARDVSFAVAPLWTHGCDHVTMEYCEIAGSTNLIDGMAIDFDGWSTNCTYRYIYSHDNNRFMRNCVYDGTTKNRGNTVDHCLSVNDNVFPNDSALPLANEGTIKVTKGRIGLVMDRFTFTNNYLINCSPTYFGNLTNATITGNYFGGRTFVTSSVSSIWSVLSTTCTGTVKDNTFYKYAPLYRSGNTTTSKAITADEAYDILFPNGVHT